jgi:glutathione S-transferase
MKPCERLWRKIRDALWHGQAEKAIELARMLDGRSVEHFSRWFPRFRSPEIPSNMLMRLPHFLSTPKLYGFSKVNAVARGHTLDLRVLWALEELQLPFELTGMDHPGHDLNTEAYRRLSPFEQIPSIDDDGLVLSESAAILVYLAKKSGRLIPGDRAGEAQVVRWRFAAMNSVEPPLLSLATSAAKPQLAGERTRMTRGPQGDVNAISMVARAGRGVALAGLSSLLGRSGALSGRSTGRRLPAKTTALAGGLVVLGMTSA